MMLRFLSCFEVYLDYVLVFSYFCGLLLFLNTLVSVFCRDSFVFIYYLNPPSVHVYKCVFFWVMS